MDSRAAKPQTQQNERSEILRRAERTASCETARPERSEWAAPKKTPLNKD
ncbi:hypothetical protein SGRA_0960 [Saprospira grandis str. Lewin]|uniref:Uncharacterized protein n=1 Tax=Saprospira grandis (strain Lewin) TaxID=984262 RepID=H6L2W9_SAPGL|nr:hypothetical protein SGRA_0960 [Saprospira grandis str. Lewin]